jgi:hypothetical protein
LTSLKDDALPLHRHYHYNESEEELIIDQYDSDENDIYDRNDWNDPNYDDIHLGVFLFHLFLFYLCLIW